MEETLTKRPEVFLPAPYPGSLKGRVPEAEWETRVELAALFRLVHHYELDDMANGIVAARSKHDPDEYLIHPYGIFWDEVRASDLIRIDRDGNVIGDEDRYVAVGVINVALWIFNNRSDVNFLIHGHAEEVQAVTATECRLQPLSQAAIYLLPLIDYIEYDFLEDEVYAKEFVDKLDDIGILAAGHHGYYAMGRTAAEALFRTYYFAQACRVQLMAMSTGDGLRPIVSDRLMSNNAAMYESDEYNYDGATEWLGWLRLLARSNPGWDE